MKVIIVGPAYPLRGGIANLNESLCAAFIKKGINCEIVSFSLQYPKFLFPGKTQYDTSGKAPNYKISSLINSVNPLSWIKTANYIKKQKPDLVVVRYWIPFMAPALGTICKLIRKKTKVIAITDNVIPHEKRIGDAFLTKYFVTKCDGFVAMSKAVLEELNQFTSNQNKLFVPHPIYDVFGKKIPKKQAIKNLHLNPNNKHILSFGLVRKYKGVDLLIKALAEEIVKPLNIKLIIAGEFYDNKQEYLSLIKQLGLEKQVFIHDYYIPTEKVKDFFCAADIVAQTYRTATQSGVTQIAYNFERPMLVTNVGGLAEIVPNTVGYVCDVSTKKIAEAIFNFYDQNKEEEFTNNVRIEKERFSWENLVDALLKAKNFTD